MDGRVTALIIFMVLSRFDILESALVRRLPTRYKVLTFEDSPVLTNSEKNGKSKVLSCYYKVPNMYDTPFPIFPEQIDPFLCSHILMSFGEVRNNTLVPEYGRDVEFYNRTIKLKEKNPDLKVLISVGGASTEAKNGFDLMMATKARRQEFIHQSIAFMKTYGFDGIDLDWEFPAVEGGRRGGEKRHEFSRLLSEFKNYTHQKANEKTYILTAAVGARKTMIDMAYDIPTIAKSLDFINLKTYDFHYYSPLTPLTGPNSPLHPMVTEAGYLGTMNAGWAAEYWHQNGMPANKITLGVPTYGRTYRLVDENYRTYYSLAIGEGSIGVKGHISYPDTCKFLSQNGTASVFHEETLEPYAYNERDWIAFGNEQSTKEKAKFVNQMGFLGISINNINSDDAWKLCEGSTMAFPIIHTAKETLSS